VILGGQEGWYQDDHIACVVSDKLPAVVGVKLARFLKTIHLEHIEEF